MRLDDTVIMDQYDTLDGPAAYELFIEGLNQQFKGEYHDAKDCVATFYANELNLLDGYLAAIDKNFQNGPGTDLV